MATALFTHRACFDHRPPHGHPESAERLGAVLAALEAQEFSGLRRIEAPRAAIEAIARVHDRRLIDTILSSVPKDEPGGGIAALDSETFLSPGSGEAILRAAGAVIAGVDAVMASEARTAFCAVRPPGHHAERAAAMGFCYFNNVAIGARHACLAHGIERVAILDFDVHHGNGTQDVFENDKRVMLVSSHQSPLYPGSGAASERGRYGNIVNLPLPPGAGSAEFRAAMSEKGLPAIADFAPGLILISAGFDAHWRDPLANLALDESDYAWITAELVRLAGRCAQGRIVSTLEGGYDLTALGSSAAAHVRALMS